jgi:hypothetical protein
MSIFNRIKEVVKTIRFSASPRLYGRSTAGAGEGQEIVVGAGLSLTGGTLAATFNETTIFGDTAPVNGVAASFTTSFIGANCNLVWTCDEIGTAGNDYSVEFVPYTDSPAPPNALPGVSYIEDSKLVRVRWGTNPSAVSTPPAASAVRSLFNLLKLNSLVPIPISCEFIQGEDGSGLVGLVAQTNLTGGSSTPTATPPYIRVANDKLYIQQAGIWKEADLNNLT